MKKFLMKYGSFMSAFALVAATMVQNRVCFALLHQPKTPDAAKSLRKF